MFNHLTNLLNLPANLTRFEAKLDGTDPITFTVKAGGIELSKMILEAVTDEENGAINAHLTGSTLLTPGRQITVTLNIEAETFDRFLELCGVYDEEQQ